MTFSSKRKSLQPTLSSFLKERALDEGRKSRQLILKNDRSNESLPTVGRVSKKSSSISVNPLPPMSMVLKSKANASRMDKYGGTLSFAPNFDQVAMSSNKNQPPSPQLSPKSSNKSPARM